jgi:hypothetical protein
VISPNGSTYYLPKIVPPQPLPLSEDVVALGTLKNGTYHLDLPHVTAAAANAIPKQHHLVHAMFNHQSLPYLRRLMRTFPRAVALRARLQPATIIPDTADCPPCHIGKQTRAPFQADLEFAQEPLDKVQTETTGRLNRQTHTVTDTHKSRLTPPQRTQAWISSR